MPKASDNYDLSNERAIAEERVAAIKLWAHNFEIIVDTDGSHIACFEFTDLMMPVSTNGYIFDFDAVSDAYGYVHVYVRRMCKSIEREKS